MKKKTNKKSVKPRRKKPRFGTLRKINQLELQKPLNVFADTTHFTGCGYTFMTC